MGDNIMIEVEAQHVKTVLQDIVLFAAPKADWLPALEGVQVVSADNILTVTATNRYIAAYETISLAVDSAEFDFFIPTDRVKLLVSQIGKSAGNISVREDGLFLIGCGSVAAGVKTGENGDFPKLPKMMERWDDARGEQREIRFNPAYLALLTKVKPYDAGKTDPLVFELGIGTSSPAKVTRGSFTAYIMPVRRPE